MTFGRLTAEQRTIRVHNVGPNHPRLTHEEYTAYLYECAKRWSAIDAKQARLVLGKAQRSDRHPEKCEVCQKHGCLDSTALPREVLDRLRSDSDDEDARREKGGR